MQRPPPSSCRASREGDSSGAPAMSMPESTVTADTPSVSFSSLQTWQLAQLALIAFWSGTLRILARRFECASSFSFSLLALQGEDTSSEPAMPRPEDPCTADTATF
eukprot:6194534-Pleurochrysis_carterae.AAC.3